MTGFYVAPAIAALLVATGAGATGQQGGEQPLTVQAVRFYSPADGTTTIEGVCELRLSALASGVAQAVRYRFEVAVADSTGLELQRHGWAREVPPAVARAQGATVMESFGFTAAPGLYRVRLRAVPEGGTAIERSIEVRAFPALPPMSARRSASRSTSVDLVSTCTGRAETAASSSTERASPRSSSMGW